MKTYRVYAQSNSGTSYRFRVTLGAKQSLRDVLNVAFPEGLIRMFTVEAL